MAPLAKSLALAGSLLAAFGSAAPLNKRDNGDNVHVVYETSTTVVWTTVDLTTTIYANIPTPTVPAQTTVISVTQAAPTVQTPEPEPETTSEEAQPTQPPQPTTTQVEEPEPTQPAVTSVPQPTYTPEPQPEPQQPTTTAVAQQPTTTAATLPAPTTGGGSSSGSSGSGSGGSWNTGDITFYDTATSATSPSSCGWTNDGETEYVVALSHEIMQDSDCGRTITIDVNGKTTTAKVVDKCMGCNANSVDASRAAFGALASMADGRVECKWKFD